MMNNMESKKPTNAQLIKRIERAIIHIDRTKDTKDIYFSDRGLRLTINEDYAIIGTGFHSHVFSRWNSSGESKPYIYTVAIIHFATTYDCLERKNGETYYSFNKLLETLKNSEERKLDYLVCYYYSMWLLNIFSPLYEIGDNEKATFITYLNYVINIAKNSILLSEHKNDITNKSFISELIGKINEFTSNIDEKIVFPKMTDEEFAEKEIDAMNENNNEQIIVNQHESENKETE